MQTKENRYHLHIMLSRAESDTLCNDAKRCGLSRSVYLRRLIMKSPVKARPTEQIGKLYEEIHRIGNKADQAAHHPERAKEEAKEAIRRAGGRRGAPPRKCSVRAGHDGH